MHNIDTDVLLNIIQQHTYTIKKPLYKLFPLFNKDQLSKLIGSLIGYYYIYDHDLIKILLDNNIDLSDVYVKLNVEKFDILLIEKITSILHNYNVNFVKTNKTYSNCLINRDEYICPICYNCQNSLEDQIILPCSHFLCKECYIKKSQLNNNCHICSKIYIPMHVHDSIFLNCITL